MDSENLKKIAAIIGKDLSEVSPDNQKLLSDFVSSLSSNAPAPGGEKVNLPATPESGGVKTNLAQPTIDPETRKLINNKIAEELSQSSDGPQYRPIRWPSGAVTYERVAKQGRAKFSGAQSDEERRASGANNLGRDLYGGQDPLRGNRLERMKSESAGAAAEQDRRQGIRDSVALPISDNAAFADGFKQQGLPTPGNKRDIFKDKDGRLEDPATLKARLIKEGMNPNDATIAAGQRSRDMFNPPNAKKDGFGMQGGQASAVMNADPERRMDVMQQLKDARKDNLQALAEARRNNPFRKEVGITTKVEAPDGTVLAQRGEGEVRTDRAGNTVDAPGRMNFLNGAANLKDALTIYNNGGVAKRPNVPLYYEGTNEPVSVGGEQRFTTVPAPTKSLVTVNPDTNTLTPVAGDPNISSKKGVELSGQGVGTKVTGAYGTAVGGISGGTPLTQEQRLGLAPLPPETQKARDALVGGPTLPQGMEMKDGKLRAYEKDPIKEQLAKNQQDALGKAADEELKKRKAKEAA